MSCDAKDLDDEKIKKTIRSWLYLPDCVPTEKDMLRGLNLFEEYKHILFSCGVIEYE